MMVLPDEIRTKYYMVARLMIESVHHSAAAKEDSAGCFALRHVQRGGDGGHKRVSRLRYAAT